MLSDWTSPSQHDGSLPLNELCLHPYITPVSKNKAHSLPVFPLPHQPQPPSVRCTLFASISYEKASLYLKHVLSRSVIRVASFHPPLSTCFLVSSRSQLSPQFPSAASEHSSAPFQKLWHGPVGGPGGSSNSGWTRYLSLAKLKCWEAEV